MKLHDFGNIYITANSLYGIQINNIDELEYISLKGWQRIGNKNIIRYRYICNTENKKIKLPCNVTNIISVSLSSPDFNKTNYEESDKLSAETYIRSLTDKNKLQDTGELLKYTQEDDYLCFLRDYNNVEIIYSGLIVDNDEGLPKLTDKEISALSCWLAYSVFYKEGLLTRNANTINLANMLKNDWLRLCNNARSPEYLSINDLDTILDIRNSWDRKSYNISYNPF